MSDKSNVCTLCPRECGINRETQTGYCKAGSNIRAAKAYLHKWEEPCISGDNMQRSEDCTGSRSRCGSRSHFGSGTIFFSHCQLRCPFCQNYEISQQGVGKDITTDELARIMLNLQKDGAYNINLVSPTPYIMQIIDALKLCKNELHIPVAMNTGGYEKVETIKLLSPYVKIFMPDVKFYSPELSKKYLNAADYFEKAVLAVEQMINQAGTPAFDKDGIMQSGVIIRHLVMPGCYHDSLEILQRLFDRFGTDSFVLSLMSQYLPCYKAADYPEINRKITTFEYERVNDFAAEKGFSGYCQQKSSAKKAFVPIWDFQGI